MTKRTGRDWSGVGIACILLLSACSGATSEPATANPPTAELAPLCSNPAPLLGQLDRRAPGYIVVLQPKVAVRTEVGRLAAKYGFTPRHVYESALQGFRADLTATAVEGLRCEASVTYVSHDAVSQIGS